MKTLDQGSSFVGLRTRQTGDAGSLRTWSMAYDGIDELTRVDSRDANGALQASESHYYTYDAVGNRASHQAGQATSQDTFNGVNQLQTRTGGGPVHVAGTVDKPVVVKLNSNHSGASALTINGNPVLVDYNGNFATDVNLPSGSGTISLNAIGINGQTTTQSWQVTSPAGAALSAPCEYDRNGNLTARYVPGSGGTITVYRYEWDALSRLTAVTVGPETAPHVPADGATRSEWTYDGQSRRVAQVDKIRNSGAWSTNQSLTFLWDGDQIVQQRDATGATVQVDYFGRGERRRISNNQLLYYTRDHLGSVREMTDASGAVRARYDYDPYGVRSKVSGDLDCVWGFTGHYYHASSGLHLALYRAYDAQLGRWLSEDPIAEQGGINLYGYVGNGPVGSWDPLGLILYPTDKISTAALQTLKNLNDPFLNMIIKRLESKDNPNVHTISASIPNDPATRKGGMAGITVAHCMGHQDTNGTGAGSAMQIPFENIPWKGDVYTPTDVLAHELVHAYDIDQGNIQRDTSAPGQTLPISEQRAYDVQDRARSELGLPALKNRSGM